MVKGDPFALPDDPEMALIQKQTFQYQRLCDGLLFAHRLDANPNGGSEHLSECLVRPWMP